MLAKYGGDGNQVLLRKLSAASTENTRVTLDHVGDTQAAGVD